MNPYESLDQLPKTVRRRAVTRLQRLRALLRAERCEMAIAHREKSERAKLAAADMRLRAYTRMEMSHDDLRRALCHITSWGTPGGARSRSVADAEPIC